MIENFNDDAYEIAASSQIQSANTPRVETSLFAQMPIDEPR